MNKYTEFINNFTLNELLISSIKSFVPSNILVAFSYASFVLRVVPNAKVYCNDFRNYVTYFWAQILKTEQLRKRFGICACVTLFLFVYYLPVLFSSKTFLIYFYIIRTFNTTVNSDCFMFKRFTCLFDLVLPNL